MARASFAKKDQSTSFGFEEGIAEVRESCIKVHQYPPNKNTGKQSDPFVCLQWGLQRLNEELDAEGGEDELIYHEFRISSNLEKARPGQDDEDLGDEVDTQGNTLCVDDTYRVWPKSGAARLMVSLEDEGGFKPAVNEEGNADNYIGMKLRLHSVPSGEKDENGRDYMNLLCKEIFDYPYDEKPKRGKKKGSKKAASKKAEDDEGGDDEVVEQAKTALQAYAEAHSEEEIPRKQLQRDLTIALTKQKVNVKVQKSIMDVIRDDEQLAELGGEIGFAVDTEDKTVAFA